MIASLAPLLLATVSGCADVPGADRLWQPTVRWVIVGEVHGTNEVPDAFANLACLAAATRRPVTIALEYPAEAQPIIDAYLASNGDAQARSALLTVPVFTAEMQDGRGSVAFLRLFERLRRMKQAGQIEGVVASDLGGSRTSGLTRDAAMAQAWTAIRTADNGLILVLVGNVHAMRRPMVLPARTTETAGSFMPAARTVTVNVFGSGGKAWNCQEDGCREHAFESLPQAAAGITYPTEPDRRWDASYELGVPTTAAPPAVTPKQMPPSGRQR